MPCLSRPCSLTPPDDSSESPARSSTATSSRALLSEGELQAVDAVSSSPLAQRSSPLRFHPISRPAAAEAGELIFAISGDLRAKKHASHLLVPTLGRKVYDLGANVEKAASFKLVGNSLILGVIELLAETMTLAEQTGVGQENLYKLIQGQSPPCLPPSFQCHSCPIVWTSLVAIVY